MTLLILFFIINSVTSDNIIDIPFKLYSTAQFFPNDTDPVISRCMTQLVVELSIGTPAQKLNSSLNLMTYHSFFLAHQIGNVAIPDFYNKSSSTYNCLKNYSEYENEDFSYAEIFNDDLQILLAEKEEMIDDNFNFFLVDELGENIPNEFYAPLIIGLKIKSHNKKFHYPKDLNFIYQLKSKGLIDKCTFTFEFNKKKGKENITSEDDEEDDEKDYEGHFIIGRDVSKDDNYFRLAIHSNEWSLNFHRIYYGNVEVEEDEQALIETEYGLTVGTINFEDIMKEFFNKQKNCYVKKIKMGYERYNYYYCDEDFDENKVDNLTFMFNKIRTNFNFTFTGKELFFSEGGKKYFNILFFAYPSYIWYLGRDFLKKNQIYFDLEGKAIYVKYDDKYNLHRKPFFWIVIIALSIIISYILFLAICSRKNERPKKLNELQEDDKLIEKEKLQDI
jgi:hypothetical protein